VTPISSPSETENVISGAITHPGDDGISQCSSAADKIALFRSWFRGREDVYPVRFESRKTGRAGYQPACANEWVRGLCEKPRVKCADCEHRRFLPVTDEVVRWHLSGSDAHGRPFVMGVYPLLPDECCHFLAVDFDRQDWRQDAGAFLQTCRTLQLPAAVERSRSGNGAHVWLFFEAAIPARLARNLGSYLLTETMEGRPDIGFGSYDRFFPNQDTLPRGGFGNLIALPLQKQARARGNSVFLDDELEPYADQWKFLASLQRISVARVEALVQEAEPEGKITGVRTVLTLETDEDEPWTAPPSRRRKEPPISGPLPETLDLVLADQLYVAKETLVPALRNRLLRLAAFQNPEFYQAQAMRLPTYDRPRIISCAEDLPQHLALPRGCLAEVQALLKSLGIKPVWHDERFGGKPIVTSFKGELRPEQQLAANALLAHDTGVLSATTAFGKTVLAAWLIARRGVNTLVLVHRQQLLEQWLERLSAFLALPDGADGRIGGGRKKPTGIVDVAIIQSLVRKGVVNDLVADYGHLIVDECHHLSAHSFELVARRAKAKYVVGLSATVTRKDGHHPIIFMQCGPIRYRVDARQQAAARPFGHTVLVRPTNFQAPALADAGHRIEFHRLYAALVADATRNRMICEDFICAVQAGRSPLLLTERVDHLQQLAASLAGKIPHLTILQGGMGKKALYRAHAERLGSPANAQLVLLATGKYIGEGFDDSRLDTLFLALPVSWRGTIAQYVGRLHRLHDGKREVRVYDYADLNVPMLAKMFDRRCLGYEAVGYAIQLPGSAIAGWPAEVSLPVAPEWKRDYAASVHRLVHDGVDPPLANLFVHAARRISAETEGVNRARSESEAFLYRRLETLRETAGRFRLNARLPISFDAEGGMEVDLYCAEARLAIELDGPQHLADHEAYRRDRRKDALLQESGCWVLRFLVEDVSMHLDEVLDAILRSLARRSPTRSSNPAINSQTTPVVTCGS
jgi:superfamily II DNA or RNA helicase/very-short-patch-repair endonuclease